MTASDNLVEASFRERAGRARWERDRGTGGEPAPVPAGEGRKAMRDIERHDPFGGAYGAALAVGAGDFVFTAVAGVTMMREGVPHFAAGFDEQLRRAGAHLSTELAHFGAGTDDIVEASVFVHPDVDVDPGALLDALSEHVFGGTTPAITI